MRRPSVLLTLLAGLLLLVLAPPAAAATPTAAFSKTLMWEGGYQGAYTITNAGSTALSGWSVEFDLPSGTTDGSYWDALLTQSGNHCTFKNREYNGTLAPGASASFGWVSNGTGTPTGCKLNGTSCTGGSSTDTAPPSTPTGVTVGSATSSALTVRWGASTDDSGSVAGYEISRDGGTPVSVTGTSYTAAASRARTRNE
ncbi:cellulose binding domain-containing protein [Streptomyces sp. NPDC001663]|uniref:cellulose binding domain-containing protein n=1 Tax=Streptomyces sp. NPDC001663 TaxID=3364597 RepID=UPI0036C1884E